MIEVVGLERKFGSTVALDGVTFSAAEGEVTGLLGPNGAGKTTCMRILCGFMPPGAGQVRVGGIDVATRSLEARRRLGYLREGAPSYPEMRVREVLRFRASLKGMRGRERETEIDRVTSACGLGEVRRRLVGQLSRGYRQRVGLADALLRDPPVLVLDEPTSGLDPNQTGEVRALVRSLAGRRTVLFSSHILSEVEAVCTKVVILVRGRVVADVRIDGLARAEDAEVVACVRAPLGDVLRLLGSLEGIRRVTPLSEEGEEVARVRIAGGGGPELRERVGAAVHEAGLPLRELRIESGGLSALFARITGGESWGPSSGNRSPSPTVDHVGPREDAGASDGKR